MRVGREEVVFVIAVFGFAGMTVAAIFWQREPSALLLGAVLAVLGYPVFLKSDRKE
jgi:ABC-type Fe3+-siderophore transport system permease subunit